MRPQCLEELVPPDHQVRIVWALVERLDLSGFYDAIRARGEDPGRSATDPRLLVALWLYAHVDGVGSARELERRCGEHAPYQWLCGGVNLNHHTLSDFRTGHEKALDALFTNLLAMMQHKGLVHLERISQDGMRVRASAGASSFRRRETLERWVSEARERVETLKRQLEGPVAAEWSAVQRAAQERAAKERMERIERALAALPQLEAAKEKLSRKMAAAKTKAVRASTTDAEARVMKMPDGGFRPAHNIQFATDVKEQVVVGVAVTNSGVDHGQMPPMIEQVEADHGRVPAKTLVDGGFAKIDDIETVTAKGTTVYAPVQAPKDKTRDAHAPRKGDSEAIAEWRVRMGTDDAKELYKQRAATAECVNAQGRAHGLTQLLVRGNEKVLGVALLIGITHNFMRWLTLTG